MIPPANQPFAPQDRDPQETPQNRLRRLRLRCWRRGIREMDLILGRFADVALADLPPDQLDALERLMEENDWDIYYWITGARPAPEDHAPLVDRIAGFHAIR